MFIESKSGFGVKAEHPTDAMSAHLHRGTITISDNSPLRASFPDLIPSKPYCADLLDEGLQIRKRVEALKRRHIQFNGPASFQWMVHDIDRPLAYFAHEDANLPAPNVIMVNQSNGHAHSAYLLGNPVARHNFARIEPLRFFAAVERGVARRLEADPHYAGLIAKNPLSDRWKVEWRRDEPYSLSDLESHLFQRDMRFDPSPKLTFGAGRNVTVFDELRSIAYREVRRFKSDGASWDAWFSRLEAVAVGINRQFPRPLNASSVRSITKSVAKWTWQRFTLEKFSARQSFLGKLGMASRWVGHVAAEKTKPWDVMGISRRTYYRRKKAGTIAQWTSQKVGTATKTGDLKMDKRVQQERRLQCRDCDGYGRVVVPDQVERGQHAGQETSLSCGGDGTQRDRLQLVMVRRLPKQKSMSLKDLKQEIRELAHDPGLGFTIGFNDQGYGSDGYDHTWLSDDDRQKALKERSVWRLEISGKRLKKSALLSPPVLIQMLAQYELKPAPS